MKPAKLTACMLSDCSEPIRARNVCAKHYKVWQRHGNAAHVARSTEQTGEPSSWQRFGPEGRWCSDLHDSDRLAVVGPIETRDRTEPASELDETNSRICCACYRQMPRELFGRDDSRASGVARYCSPCVVRNGLEVPTEGALAA